MKKLIVALAMVILAGTAWAGEWDGVQAVSGISKWMIDPRTGDWVACPGGKCPQLLPCPYQFRAIPADEAEEWSRNNPGWEPFGVTTVTEFDQRGLGNYSLKANRHEIWFKKRVCEGEE